MALTLQYYQSGDFDNTILRKLLQNQAYAIVNGIGGGGSGDGVPGGANGSLQYNNAGNFGGYTPGTGVVTFLQTPSSANLAAAVTDETGSGALVFATSPTIASPTLSGTTTVATANATTLNATTLVIDGASITQKTGTGKLVLDTSPTLVTPVLGTPSSGNLSNCTADGTNPVGTKNLPQNAKTAGYTLLASDSGKVVPNTTGGWTVDNSVHAAGDVISLYNDSGSSQSITQGTITTMRLAGTTTTGTRTLAARGFATLYFHSATEVIVSGVGVT